MSKFKKTRIFLKDDKGKYYRVCSVYNQKDSRGEYYIKIMFPDIKGIPLIAGHHNKGLTRVESRLNPDIQEFSYHYRSGVSHFKNAKDKIDSKRNMPTLHKFPALHLLRYTIRSLIPFEVQDPSKITADDFVLPIIFNGDPRGFEFAISKIKGGWNVINEQGNDPISTYKIPLEDTNVSLHISDAIWRRPPLVKGESLFEIFTHDDPAEPFDFKPIE